MKEFLRCLLLPLQSQTLIVPYSAVAEIILYDKANIKNDNTNANGVACELNWRGIKVPLISLETFSKQEKEQAEYTPIKMDINFHIAVLNRIDEVQVSFVGLMLHGVPTIRRYKRQDFKLVTISQEPHLLMEILVCEQTVFIPNIKWIEEHVAKS